MCTSWWLRPPWEQVWHQIILLLDLHRTGNMLCLPDTALQTSRKTTQRLETYHHFHFKKVFRRIYQWFCAEVPWRMNYAPPQEIIDLSFISERFQVGLEESRKSPKHFFFMIFHESDMLAVSSGAAKQVGVLGRPRFSPRHSTIISMAFIREQRD